MDIQQLLDLRLTNQQIASPTFTSPEQVVHHLEALQAQDYPGALWSIGLRTTGSTLKDVEAAIDARKIVRTWPMRGTLHFVAAEDIRWMLRLLTPRIIAGAGHRNRNLELDESIFTRSREIFAKALAGDKQLTRSAMCGLLEDVGISTKGQRGIHILWQLSQEGLLCFASHQGKEPAFALLEEWVPKVPSKTKEEALAELAERYFLSHGPATLQDFMWWSGLKAVDVRQGLAASQKYLRLESLNGRDYWLGRDASPDPAADSQLFLLPGFDEYMLGYRDRSAGLIAEHGHRIVPGNNGMFISTIVDNGTVIGLWKRTPRAKAMKLTATLFGPAPKRLDKDLAKAAARYGQFIGLPVDVVVQD